MSVLITGFEPFEGDSYNVSMGVAERLDGTTIKGEKVFGRSLPVTRYEAIEVLKKYTDELSPKIVICLGYAAFANSIRLERIAVNIDDFRIPDNSGNQPIDEPIFEGSPLAYHSQLPIKACTKAIREANIPAHISDSAGTYLCNHIFYGAVHLSQQVSQNGDKPFRAGFIHIPPDEYIKTKPEVIALADQVKALSIVIENALDNAQDIKCAGLGKGYD